MIRMSRSAGRAARATAWAPISSVWYALCLGLGGGCFYIGPPPAINQPPEILVPEEGAGEEIPVILNQVTVLKVVAADRDSEEVACFWTIDGRDSPDFTCDRQDLLVFTVLTLEFDPELDDTLVVAHIFDAESNEDTTVHFRLLIDDPGAE